MANSEDVLAEWCFMSHVAETDSADRAMVNALLSGGDALAAEVRELRRDRRELRKELHKIVGIAFDDGYAHHHGPSAPRIMALTDLVDIALDRDSAMAAERGEGE